MDSKKLQALRARYEGAAGSDIDDPDFRKAAGAQFSDSDRRKWPFADPATFLGAPFLPDAAGSDFAGVDIALIGVPRKVAGSAKGHLRRSLSENCAPAALRKSGSSMSLPAAPS